MTPEQHQQRQQQQPLLPLAVSLGDPAGIGPEIIAALWADRGTNAAPPFFVCGGANVLQKAAALRGLDLPIMAVSCAEEALAGFASALPVLEGADGEYTPGEPSIQGAKLALASLEQACASTTAGLASGCVTMPVAKAQLGKVGFDFPGQTEFVADRCGVSPEDAVMMLAGPNLRTVPITVHCALVDVPQVLSAELIVRKARIVAEALQHDFGIAAPRLAVCGLNPHAGEDGRMGQEDTAIIAPAIAQLRAEGIEASGPHPADALFTARARPTYDAALGMYHDQALIPIKTLDFDEGVNVTLGLPIIRTSPDHGTAFAIAGQSEASAQASPKASLAALKLARDCALMRASHG